MSDSPKDTPVAQEAGEPVKSQPKIRFNSKANAPMLQADGKTPVQGRFEVDPATVKHEIKRDVLEIGPNPRCYALVLLTSRDKLRFQFQVLDVADTKLLDKLKSKTAFDSKVVPRNRRSEAMKRALASLQQLIRNQLNIPKTIIPLSKIENDGAGQAD